MSKKQLESKIIRLSKNLEKGDKFELLYDGCSIGEYEYDGDMSIDTKTPLEWLRGCICFGVTLKNGDIGKVQLKYSKA